MLQAGANVWQYEANGTDAQKWLIKKTEDGYYNIISKCNGLYLNVTKQIAKNESNIEVNTKNDSNSQKFKLEKIEVLKGEKTISDGTYEIRSVSDKRYALDIDGASKNNGANVQLYEYVKQNQQKFKVKYIGDGYYTITALHSGKVLDVANF